MHQHSINTPFSHISNTISTLFPRKLADTHCRPIHLHTTPSEFGVEEACMAFVEKKGVSVAWNTQVILWSLLGHRAGSSFFLPGLFLMRLV